MLLRRDNQLAMSLGGGAESDGVPVGETLIRNHLMPASGGPRAARVAGWRELPDSMGSIDWAWCEWCWYTIWTPYIIDRVGCLCSVCQRRWLEGLRPPWQPDGVARMAHWLRQFFDPSRDRPASRPLPEELHERIALYLIRDDVP